MKIEPASRSITVEAANEFADSLRAEGVRDERWIAYLAALSRPGGEQAILPGETREAAVARLQRHYGWDERTASQSIQLSEGWSDVVPVGDDGTEVPIDRLSAAEREAWGLE